VRAVWWGGETTNSTAIIRIAVL